MAHAGRGGASDRVIGHTVPQQVSIPPPLGSAGSTSCFTNSGEACAFFSPCFKVLFKTKQKTTLWPSGRRRPLPPTWVAAAVPHAQPHPQARLLQASYMLSPLPMTPFPASSLLRSAGSSACLWDSSVSPLSPQ